MNMTMRLSVVASAALMSLGMSGSVQAQQQAPNTTFFVTSAGPGKGADLGGLEGADRHCQQLAATVGAGGKSVDDLHSDNNKLTSQTALTERGTIVAGVGFTPNQHDALTGSTAEGRAWPPNLNLTCNNWSSSAFGSAMLGHIDRSPQMPENLRSWNAAHMSRSCSQPDLIATGGNGLFYCFAQ